MRKLSLGEKYSVLYHDVFDFPLTSEELVKWKHRGTHKVQNKKIIYKNDHFLITGKEINIRKRHVHHRESQKKLKIAFKASKAISIVPTVKVVALSGALAMNNASKDSDIDLLIVTSAGLLWVTRPMVYLILKLSSNEIRKPDDADEKDKLCLNLWMDESDLVIKDQNDYTAHELAQLVPLVNKDKIFEKLLSNNKWILDYWPNSVEIKRYKYIKKSYVNNLLNLFAYKLQKAYMNKKMTSEKVSLTRAFFHPRDWGLEIEKKLKD